MNKICDVGFFFTNRSDIEWLKLDDSLREYNYEVCKARKDGFCFLTSLKECILRDHRMNLPLNDIKDLIESEIYENNYVYKPYYTGSTKDMLRALDNYLANGQYSHNVVDVAIMAAANCLGVNLCIFKCVDGKALLYFICSNRPSSRDVYLKYEREHYDSIVWKQEDEEVSIKETDPIDPDTRKFFNEQGVFFSHHKSGEVQDFNDIDNPSSPQVNKDVGQKDVTTVSEAKEIPEKYRFVEEYSGNEDAVLNNSSGPESESDIAGTKKSEDSQTGLVDEEALPSSQESRIFSSQDSSFNSDSMSSVFSDSSAGSMSRISRTKPKKHFKNNLNEERMAKVEVEAVDEVPWDINGDKIYELRATEKDYKEKYRDGRWFLLKDSSRVGLNDIRKIGSCHGSVICCRPDCSKLTSEGSVNTLDFRRRGKKKQECKSCGYMAPRVYCGCVKAIELDYDRGTLRIFHQGTHICHLKPNVPVRRKALDDLPLPITGSTKAKKYMHDCFKYHLENDDIDAAFNVCDAVCEDDVIAQIKRMRKYPNKSVHRQDVVDAFSHICRIKGNLLKSDKDKYLIYKWECTEMDGRSSYVFKTSEVSLAMALKMAGRIKIGTEDSSLNEEPAFFDGMHKRVKHFVTHTLWVFHPGRRLMQALAVMDASGEDALNIELFFDTFNKALAEYIEEPGYIWDPFMIMMDEKGANFEAISRVFGENFRQSKVKTCQFHFMQCGERYLMKCPVEERKTFRRWCRELCDSHTRKKYRHFADLICEKAKEYDFMGWWKFWCPRSPHIVPALRGFNLPKMNLAEVGQSKMRADRKMWLSEAAYNDMAALAFQSARYKKFVANREKIIGKGPTLKCQTQKE